jgi:hypothetical protein
MLLVVYLLSGDSKESVAYFIFRGYFQGECFMEEQDYDALHYGNHFRVGFINILSHDYDTKAASLC